MKIDDWICFHGDDDVLETLLLLKTKFLSSFVRRIASDGRSWSHSDEAVVQCIVNVLSGEEDPKESSKSNTNWKSSKSSKKTNDRERNENTQEWIPMSRGPPRGRGGRG